MKTYTVSVEVAGREALSEDAATGLSDALASHGGAVRSVPVTRSFSVIMSVRSGNPLDALREALSAFSMALSRAGYPVGKIVKMSAKTEEGTA